MSQYIKTAASAAAELLQYYNHFTGFWTLSRSTRVSQYQKGKTSKVKPI